MRVGRVEDGSIYHYTRASTFINFIAPYGRLRLAPFSASIDPRERLPVNLSLATSQDLDDREFETWIGRQSKLTEMIRSRAHMLCFANSYAPLYPRTQWDHEGDRGWAQTAMWAHFAEQHSGVCLEIDKQAFLQDLQAATSESAIVLTGDVVYLGSGDQPLAVPNLMVDAISDATAERMFAHVVHNAVTPFFRKDQCWAYEQEFRVVALNSCGEPVYVPIVNSLRRVILGDALPPHLRPVMEWLLERAGMQVPMPTMRWTSGPFAVGPVDDNSVKEVGALASRQPPLSNPNPCEHIHNDRCKPVISGVPSSADRLDVWRDILFHSYGRRLSRALEQISAELGFTFSTRRRILRQRPGSSAPTPMDQFILLWELSGATLEILFAPPLPIHGSPSASVVYIEINSTTGVHNSQEWPVSDALSDSGIMALFDQIDRLVNEALGSIEPWRYPNQD